MGRLYNKKYLNKRRRDLRNNETDAEKYLWYELKNHQVCGKKFRRQHSVGNYIIDFYCPEIKLAIELDGEHHAEEKHLIYDMNRTRFLESLGITVLRFKNTNVLFGRNEVVEKIKRVLNKKDVKEIFQK